MGLASMAVSLLALAVSFLIADPFQKGLLAGLSFHPEPLSLPPLSKGEAPSDPHNKLLNAERKYVNDFFGPESLAFDHLGRGPYASLSDGRVVRRKGDDSGWETVAVLSPIRDSKLCDYLPAPATPAPNLPLEHICGRPLGIRLHPITGDLFVADAYFGLYRVPFLGNSTEASTEERSCRSSLEALVEQVGVQTGGTPEEASGFEPGGGAGITQEEERTSPGVSGAASCPANGETAVGKYPSPNEQLAAGGMDFGKPELLVNSAEGTRFNFTNDLDIDAAEGGKGVVYFTDTSVKHQRRNFLVAILEGSRQGRLLKYDIASNVTTVLARRLAFPNGVALSRGRTFFVFCETTLMRCHKYHIKGPKAGTFELLLHIPGFPDNVRLNPRGRFWISVHARRNPLIEFVMKYPILRFSLLKLLPNVRLVYGLAIGKPHGMVIEVDEQGSVTDVLEDKTGTVAPAISEVEEHGGKLWMGSVLFSHIAVLNYSP